MDEEIRKRGKRMKSYGHLFNEVLLRDDTISSTIDKAADGKNKNNKRHRKLRYIRANKDEYIPKIKSWIINYEPAKITRIVKVINDGISAKKRTITVPTYQEEEILNAETIVLKQILEPSMYEHSYSSIEGRGTHKASNFIAKWMKRDCVGTQLALQMDIRHFFESVNRSILYNKVKKKIRDKDFLNLCKKTIYATPGNFGLPLGFPTSQTYANYYLTDLDHYIKERLGVKYYVRFSDDMLIMSNNKLFLWYCKDRIEDYLEKNLCLTLKPNYKIFPLDHSNPSLMGNKLDFLGYKHTRDYKTLRKKILGRFKRKVHHVHKKGCTNIKDARQIVTYASYLKHAKCHGWYEREIKPYVNLHYMRIKISRYSKKEEHLCGTKQQQTLAPI